MSDEKSAIQWVRQQLRKADDVPGTPAALHEGDKRAWEKHEEPIELMNIWTRTSCGMLCRWRAPIPTRKPIWNNYGIGI